MDVGLALVLMTLIVCASTLFGYYMHLCLENKIKMFSDPMYEKRIRDLEKSVKELEEKNK